MELWAWLVKRMPLCDSLLPREECVSPATKMEASVFLSSALHGSQSKTDRLDAWCLDRRSGQGKEMGSSK
jgi:hypothetical protein